MSPLRLGFPAALNQAGNTQRSKLMFAPSHPIKSISGALIWHPRSFVLRDAETHEPGKLITHQIDMSIVGSIGCFREREIELQRQQVIYVLEAHTHIAEHIQRCFTCTYRKQWNHNKR